MLNILPLPCLDDNYIWVLRQGRQVLAVDPGDATPLLEYLQNNDLELSGILLTHRHADHVNGVPALREALAPPVYGPPSVAGVTHPVNDGDILKLLGASWQVIATPGHTHEHLAYYGAGALFCGDALFGAGCGRLFDGTPEEMHASLMRLATLPADTLVFSAHEYTLANLRFAAVVEPDNAEIKQRQLSDQVKREEKQPTLPSTIAVELATNPFLRCDAASVIESARRHNSAARTPIEVFATIRDWKNHFK